MNMACVQSTAVNLFDEYCLLIPPKLKSYQDGPPGQRVIIQWKDGKIECHQVRGNRGDFLVT